MKTCVDCKHYTEETVLHSNVMAKTIIERTERICGHPNNADPVTGRVLNRRCGYARSSNGHCGPLGSVWEAKE